MALTDGPNCIIFSQGAAEPKPEKTWADFDDAIVEHLYTSSKYIYVVYKNRKDIAAATSALRRPYSIVAHLM